MDRTSTGSTLHSNAAVDAWNQAHDLSEHSGLRIEEVHGPDSFHEVSRVLNTIWSTPETPIIDHSILTAMAHAGNPILLVCAHGQVIGAAVGFCGPAGEPFHSHIVGLLPGSVGRGLGLAVKAHQRAWCLDRGITEMTWTYDPLVGRNAFFNIARLGATPIEYLPDFYGRMTDSINSGQLSDRMLVRWDLERPIGGCESIDRIEPIGGPDPEDIQRAVSFADTTFLSYSPPEHHSIATVAVPRDIETLRTSDPDLAYEWRLVVRAALTDLMDNGWSITGFSRESAYILHHRNSTSSDVAQAPAK